MDEFEKGVILGLLIGEGYFGGCRRYPSVVLKMHVRHMKLLQWVHKRLIGSKLYGPYNHDGRNYYQLMIRGKSLRTVLIPFLSSLPWEEIDDHSHSRFRSMIKRYGLAGEPLT